MKKSILILSCTLMCTAAFADRVVYTHEKNGGVNGYKDVLENHEGGIDALSCEDPGNNACKWKIPPATKTSKDYYDIREMVVQQIMSGDFNGELTVEGVPVTWDALSIRDFQFNIQVPE